jgi:ribosome-associated heat shock protein Hsp15
LNGSRAKPARRIGLADQLRIRKAQLIYEITIKGLGEKRVSATLAQQMYSEAQQSIEMREQRQQTIRADRQTLINGRPSKKDRRQQQAIKRSIETGG